MTDTLPRVAHEHHERLLHHVDEMPAVGARLLAGDASEIKALATETSSFLTETLVPHMEAAERALYPELERMLQNRHSMSPMRREHDDLRRLVRSFVRLAGQLDEHVITTGTRLSIRRVLFQLYALLEIHLAEEEAYLHIVEHGVTDEAADVLAGALEHPISMLEREVANA
jgi:iron-sulfur cluster repair protein YtfE (RIC family)